MNKDLKWTKIGEDRHFKAGWRKMINKRFRLLNGKEADYDIRDEGKTVNIVALTKENRVVLIEVFRPGPERILKEIPGGFVGEDEDILLAAKRELLEETGYSGDFEFVENCVDDAYSNCERNCVIAKNCTKISEPITTEDDEECEIILMSIDEFRRHLRSGQLTDTEIGYLALDYLKLL